MEKINLIAAWVGIFSGLITGAIIGLFFHAPDWLGGYASWERRMLRLGHIACFGTAFINLAFALTVSHMGLQDASPHVSRLLILGAVTMPLVCFLSAYKKGFRHLFFIPVLSLTVGTFLFLIGGLSQ